jgi:hypothetical protein
MRELVEKLKQMEREIAAEKGAFHLFALFLREDAPDVWDLLVSAPWIEADKGAALKYLAGRLNQIATPKELTSLSRIVIIDESDPALSTLRSAMTIEHGSIELKDVNFFGLEIKHALVITSRGAGG